MEGNKGKKKRRKPVTCCVFNFANFVQTPSTALRHPPWSKGAGKRDMRVCSLCKLQALFYDILLGVVEGAGNRGIGVCSLCKLQALLYDILLGEKVSKSETWQYTTCANSKHCFTTPSLETGYRKAGHESVQLVQTPSTALRHPPWSKGAGKRGMRVCSLCKLQALLYDILLGGKVPESEAWIVKCALSLSWLLSVSVSTDHW